MKERDRVRALAHPWARSAPRRSARPRRSPYLTGRRRRQAYHRRCCGPVSLLSEILNDGRFLQIRADVSACTVGAVARLAVGAEQLSVTRGLAVSPGSRSSLGRRRLDRLLIIRSAAAARDTTREGLARSSTRPARRNQPSPIVGGADRQLRAGHPGLGPRRIASALACPRWGGSPSRTTTHRTCSTPENQRCSGDDGS